VFLGGRQEGRKGDDGFGRVKSNEYREDLDMH
jgi:hypothetical protein